MLGYLDERKKIGTRSEGGEDTEDTMESLCRSVSIPKSPKYTVRAILLDCWEQNKKVVRPSEAMFEDRRHRKNVVRSVVALILMGR